MTKLKKVGTGYYVLIDMEGETVVAVTQNPATLLAEAEEYLEVNNAGADDVDLYILKSVGFVRVSNKPVVEIVEKEAR